MPTFSYQLRPGVELSINVKVSLRRNLDNPTPEMVANRFSDSKTAQFTLEYMQTHAQRALSSLDETRLLSSVLSTQETLSKAEYHLFITQLCCKPKKQTDEEFLAEFLNEIRS